MPTATPTGGVWSPLEKEIGYHRANGGWQADGCMTAPVDQSAACRSGTPAPAPLPSPTVPPLPTPTPWKPTATPLPYPSPTVPPPVDTFPYPYPSPTAPQPIPLPQPYPSPTAPPPVDIFPYPLPTVPPPVDTFPSPYPPSPYPTYPPQPLPTPAYPGVPPGALPLTSASATAPPLASVSAPSDPRVVAAGAEVPCAVQNAQDFDTYTKTVDGIVTKTYGADGPLTYQWSADKGKFKNGVTFGQNVTWIAPDDVTEATNVIIRCTIDDPPGPRVFAPDTGSHDDDPTVRVATVKVVPALSFSLDKTSIVAGGWDETRHAYEYLEKESGKWKPRDQKPDPHIATLTATLKDGRGNPLPGKSVTFKWDMPGPAPEITRTETTDSDGVATVDVVSGDTLSKAFDEQDGHLLYDEPVVVEVSYGETKQSKKLDVLAPDIEWQIKNSDGNYVHWDGDTWDNYYKSDESHKVPLRALLTFDGAPVIGHRVSWGFDKIFDKAQVEVLRNNPTYKTYGRMSGEISTTPLDGGATATYTLSYNMGQIIFAIDDSSIYRKGATSSVEFSDLSLLLTQALEQPTGERRSRKTFYKGSKTGVYRFVHDSPYNDIDGRPNSVHKEAYPAPSGGESNELIKQTYDLVTAILAGRPTSVKTASRPTPIFESKTGWRLQNFIGPGGERRIFQHGDWWFSQVVGDDPESFGYHKADVKVPIPGKSDYYRYSGAFDIVLTGVPIFAQVPNNPRKYGRRKEFGPYVKALRDNGIVAWHRWAGEADSTSENEMHCIDPATPFLKGDLQGQIGKFLLKGGKGTGGSSYPTEPVNPNDPFYAEFHINVTQQNRVRDRRKHKIVVRGATGDTP